MSDRVPPPAPSLDALEDQVDDLLGDIEEAIKPTSMHPLGPRHEAPEPEPELDPLEELSVVLQTSTEESNPVITMALVDDDEDEITQQWQSPTMREFAEVYAIPESLPGLREKLPSIVDEDSFEETGGTLRPSSISFAPIPFNGVPGAGGARKRSFWSRASFRQVPFIIAQGKTPRALAITAGVAVVAAAVAYGLGPFGEDPSAAPAAGVALSEPLGVQPLEGVVERGESPQARQLDDRPASATNAHRITFTINPSNAYLSVRRLDEVNERRSGGPWPRAVDLEPGEYEMVVFRAGYRALVRRLTVNDTTPHAMDIVLRVEDIYE